MYMRVLRCIPVCPIAISTSEVMPDVCTLDFIATSISLLYTSYAARAEREYHFATLHLQTKFFKAAERRALTNLSASASM